MTLSVFTSSLPRSALSLSRHELFAALYVAGFFNGISTRAAYAISTWGFFSAAQSGFDASWVVWLAAVLGLRLTLIAPARAVSRRDLFIAVICVALLLWPLVDLSWVAITVLATHAIASGEKGSQQWASGMVFLSIAVAMLWAKAVPYFFGNSLERIDIFAVSWIMGVKSFGNVLYMADGTDNILVGWSCTSFANASLALLLWVAITRTVRPMHMRGEWLNLAGVFAAVFVINSVRMALATRSRDLYHLVHDASGLSMFNAALLLAALAVTLYGVRHELAR